MNRISQSSVLKKVKVLRNATGHSLPEKEELQLQKLLNDKDRKNVRSDDDEETGEMEPKEKKKKRKKVKPDEDDTTSPAEKKKKTNAGKAVAVAKKGKKTKGAEEKAKKEKKPKKPPVDKSDPNWRLKPNVGITVWEKDPLFESKFTDASLPYVSSTAHSRLAIAAVLTKGNILSMIPPGRC